MTMEVPETAPHTLEGSIARYGDFLISSRQLLAATYSVLHAEHKALQDTLNDTQDRHQTMMGIAARHQITTPNLELPKYSRIQRHAERIPELQKVIPRNLGEPKLAIGIAAPQRMYFPESMDTTRELAAIGELIGSRVTEEHMFYEVGVIIFDQTVSSARSAVISAEELSCESDGGIDEHIFFANAFTSYCEPDGSLMDATRPMTIRQDFRHIDSRQLDMMSQFGSEIFHSAHPDLGEIA